GRRLPRPPSSDCHPGRAGALHRPPDGAPAGAGLMSAPTPSPVPPAHPAPGGFGERLPQRLAARTVELPGLGTLRLVETMVLVVVGLLLAVATVNDVVLQTHTNHRIVADLRSWREYTGHDYQNVGVEQDIYGP